MLMFGNLIVLLVVKISILFCVYRKRLYTTNSLEQPNEEIRRYERVIRIFPNRESAIRLIGTLLMEQEGKWASGILYYYQ